MRDVGLELQGVRDAIYQPLGNLTRLGSFAGRKLGSLLVAPAVPVRNAELEPEAAQLGKLIRALGTNVQKLLIQHQMGIVDRQYQLGRIADVATELYVSACVLNRLDTMLRDHHDHDAVLRLQLESGHYYLLTARRRIRQTLAALWDNDDDPRTICSSSSPSLTPLAVTMRQAISYHCLIICLLISRSATRRNCGKWRWRHWCK
jgi:hypothetical protein